MQSAVRLDVVDQGQTIAMIAYTITINLKTIHGTKQLLLLIKYACNKPVLN